MTPVNSTLGLREIPSPGDGESRFGVVGNTVQRLCPHGENCAGHADQSLSFVKRLDSNCASANTEAAFRESGQEDPKGRFMLLPTSDEVLILGQDEGSFSPFMLTDEDGTKHVAFNKLKPARAVVIGEQWAKEQKLESITAGLNGADSTFGTMSLTVDGEKFVIAFCTTRENLGDRPEEFQVLRKAVNTILDAKGITDSAERERQLASLSARIDLMASATLKNFAHDIRVPQPGTNQAKELASYLGVNAEEFTHKYEMTERIREIKSQLAQKDLPAELRRKLENDLASLHVADAITPNQIIDWQYPKALEDGFVYKASDIALGQAEPVSAEEGLGFGELYHVDYRGITKASIVNQLVAMGMAKKSIDWHEENAIDPADPDNDLASNRREQLAGVSIATTDRTFNGVKIDFA